MAKVEATDDVASMTLSTLDDSSVISVGSLTRSLSPYSEVTRVFFQTHNLIVYNILICELKNTFLGFFNYQAGSQSY